MVVSSFRDNRQPQAPRRSLPCRRLAEQPQNPREHGSLLRKSELSAPWPTTAFDLQFPIVFSFLRASAPPREQAFDVEIPRLPLAPYRLSGKNALAFHFLPPFLRVLAP